MMTAIQTRIVVAGTAGGVGATTVASMLFASLSGDPLGSDSHGVPELLDHAGGDLGLRLPEGDDAATIDHGLAIQDLGAHALDEALELLADSSVFVVVVTASTPGGMALAERAVGLIRDRHSSSGVQRTLVVAVGTFGRHRIHTQSERIQNLFGRHSVVLMPQDAALAPGGRIPLARLSAESRRAAKQLTSRLRARLATRASGRRD
jgi:MinD-like ATPase involved in chromosome partitioning or flagellar assembly